MGKWEEVLVSDIANNIQYGYTGKTIEEGKYRYLRITDIQKERVNWDIVPFSDISKENEISKYHLQENDIVFARTGATVGKSFLIKEVVPSIFASYLIRIQPSEKIFPEFLYQFFQSDNYWQQIRGHEVGAAQPNVNGKKLGQIKIPLPPLKTQKQIVSKLDALFARIDKSIGLLEENIQHTKDLMASVLDGIYEKHNDKMFTVEDICYKITDGTHSTPKYTDKGVHFLSVKDISKGVIDLSNTRYISKEEHDILYKRCNPEKGDILYTKVGTTGIAKVVDIEDEFSLFVSVALLKPKENILPIYFELILNSPKAYEQAQSRTRGVANRNLVLKDIKEIKIPLPSIKEQKNIVEFFNHYKIKHNNLLTQQTEKLKHLQSLKSSLLDMAFKGELVE